MFDYVYNSLAVFFFYGGIKWIHQFALCTYYSIISSVIFTGIVAQLTVFDITNKHSYQL